MDGELQFDGASRGNPGPAGYGYVIQTPDATVTEYNTIGTATNNEAEYRGLSAGLSDALNRGITSIRITGDSELIVKQVQGTYAVNAENLIPLHEETLSLLHRFSDWAIEYVPREENTQADTLANEALGSAKQHRQQ